MKMIAQIGKTKTGYSAYIKIENNVAATTGSDRNSLRENMLESVNLLLEELGMPVVSIGQIVFSDEVRQCVIKLMPDSDVKANVLTGGVSSLEILDMLQNIQKHFAQAFLKEYAEFTGDKNLDPDKLDEYMNFMRNNGL